jgi:hypothetical protein
MTLIQSDFMSRTVNPELEELIMSLLTSVKSQILARLNASMAALRKPRYHTEDHETDLLTDSPIHDNTVIKSAIADQNQLNRGITTKSTKGEISSRVSDYEVEEQSQSDG